MYPKDAPALSRDQVKRVEATVASYMTAQDVPGMSVALVISNLEDLPARNELIETITRIALRFDRMTNQ